MRTITENRLRCFTSHCVLAVGFLLCPAGLFGQQPATPPPEVSSRTSITGYTAAEIVWALAREADRCENAKQPSIIRNEVDGYTLRAGNLRIHCPLPTPPVFGQQASTTCEISIGVPERQNNPRRPEGGSTGEQTDTLGGRNLPRKGGDH